MVIDRAAPREDVDLYLDTRADQGFNTILVNLLEHKFATNAPGNAYGDAPFLTPGDFSTPNDAYFEHVDWVVQRAAEAGFLVLLAPAYMGYRGSDQGWYEEMKDSGVAKLREYGRYLGERYRDAGNIIWVQAGDYDPPDPELADAVAEGIAEVEPSALQTAHGAPDTAAADFWGDRPWLSVNNIYPSHDPYDAAIEQYRRSALPYFLIEALYENEHGVTSQGLRAQAYLTLLSGGAGQVFGNNPMWHFDGPGAYPIDVTWQEALESDGARSMQHVRELFDGFDWWRLRPETDDSFIVSGSQGGDERAVSAVACDGSFALVYVPSERDLTIDPSQVAGERVSLSWYDPTSGTSTPLPGSPFSTSEPVEVGPSGPNAEGEHDWVLVVEGS